MERPGDSGARRLTSTAPAVVGLVLALAGATLLVVGWWGVSGESVVSLQVPYLASASIPGAALVIAGAVLVAGTRRRLTDERIDALYALLTEPLAVPPTAVTAAPDDFVTVDGGTRWHRADCALVAGKPTAAVTDTTGLTACPVCQPSP